MNWFNNLKIKKKLGLGFSLCIVMTLAVGVMGVRSMSTLNDSTRKIVDDPLAGITAIDRIQDGIADARLGEMNYGLSPKEDRAKIASAIGDSLGLVDKQMENYSTTIVVQEDRDNFAHLKDAFGKFKQMNAEYLKAIDSSSKNSDEVARNMIKSSAILDEPVEKMAKWSMERGQSLSKEASNQFVSVRNQIIAIIAIAVCFGLFVSRFVSKIIANPILAAVNHIEKLRSVCITNLGFAIKALEQGDLTVDIPTGTTPLPETDLSEVGDLARSFNGLLEITQDSIGSFQKSQHSLSSLVRNLQSSAASVNDSSVALGHTAQNFAASTEQIAGTMREVASASDQAARGATEVAQGSTVQARSVSESADLVKELASAVNRVSKDANDASDAAFSAGEAASDGSKIVNQSLEGMKGIQIAVKDSANVITTLGESSQKIGSIVDTINEIAEQTNLLALNAAIEAARAGEAGRGFAVVADEVRKLAERSGSATREIRTLIADIQRQTDQAVESMQAGTVEVEQQAAKAELLGQAFSNIEGAITDVTKKVNEIGTAASQMTNSSDQVSKSMAEVAAVVEESSAAAEELSASAEQVSASVQTVSSSTDEQASSIRELTSAAHSLENISKDLQTVVSQFKVAQSDKHLEDSNQFDMRQKAA